MKKTVLLFLLFSGMNIFSIAQVLDQMNASVYNSGWVVNSGAYTAVGQSFTSGYTGELASIVISIDTPSVTYPVIPGTFEIRVYDGNGFTGTLLGTESFFVPTGLPYGDFEITFSNIINVVNGNQYTYAVEEISGTGQIQMNATANNYSGGNLYSTILTTTTSFPSYDLLFKTYVRADSYASIDVTECGQYTGPSGNNTWNTSGVYYDTIPNSMGGDSIITINLTVNQVDINVTNNSPELIAVATGAAYQWLDCNNGFAELSGETSQNYTSISSGSYAVEVTQNGCIDTSACFTINMAGLFDIDSENEFSVYPNPTSGEVNIEFESDYESVNVIIRNVMGQEISNTTLSKTNTLNLILDCADGMYFVEILTGNKQTFVVLLKE